MLPRADIITVRPVGAAELVAGPAAVGDARQEQFQRSLAGLIGQSVQAEVMSKLTDGSFLVKVADTSARMMLPPGAQIGQRVPLTLVSVSPRPTFQITSGADDGAPVHIAYAEAGPALLPGPDGSPARAQPLVYLDGSAGQLPGAQGKANRASTGLPVPPPMPDPAAAPTDADDVPVALSGGRPAAPAPAPPPAAANPAAAAAAAATLPPVPPALAAALAAADEAPVPPDLPELPAPLEADPDDPASFLTQPRPAAAGTPAPAAAAAAANAAAAKAAASGPAPAADTDPANPAAAPADAPAPPGAAAAARSQAADQARPLSHAAALLGKAPIMPANQLPALGPQTAAASLSDTAKVLAQVLTQALKIRNAPTSIIGRSPLVGSGDSPPAQIEQALHGAVGKSGLFYESHVAQWAFGQRPLADLVVEPQMQQALGASQAAAASVSGNVPTDPATAGFINLQLATQEQEKVAWQGQVWPGQDMQWEIKKDAPDRRGGREQEEPGWQSAMRLRFAQLGTVDAKVLLRGDSLQIKIHAGSAETAELFRRYSAQLESALAAAGLPLSLLQVTEPVGAPEVPPAAGAGGGSSAAPTGGAGGG